MGLWLRQTLNGTIAVIPFPGYCMPMSTPSLILAAAVALDPSWKWRIATRMRSLETRANADEVPVDVVVDRLLSHLAMGTRGCVPAMSGKQARAPFQGWWNSIMELRRIPWTMWPIWLDDDSKSREQSPINRLYRILGISLSFSEDRTVALSRQVSREECASLELFSRVCVHEYAFSRH